MNQSTATTLINQTFNAPFDEAAFTQLAANLLNKVDRSKAVGLRAGNIIPQAYRGHISTYRRPFVYIDPNGERVDVLIVRLAKPVSLERARTMQRNFIAHYITQLAHDQSVDGVLAAFYHPDVADWRFSLVKLEYLFGDEGAEEKLTPARRYSFLVGPNEPTHTAARQLLPLLVEDGRLPTLDQLTDAFRIEVVGQRFFEAYKELFLRLVEALNEQIAQDPTLRRDFERAAVHLPDFAKKLLGQIVFLYFVQKKGWLGVAPGDLWGSGPRDFLRRLFERQDGVAYDNFFDDLLEPLFYRALAIKRTGDRYQIGDFVCQIPFLNGGLFEPMGSYDWQNTHLRLPNRLFSNRQDAHDDQGSGILDVFDRYNFTVWEEEPLEKEVAVDPEMLGQVFENLLEVEDRKSKGAFYTPREIVHYMCQESLINYLDSQIGPISPPIGAIGPISPPTRAEITVLVRQGALALQQDAAKEAGLQKGEYVLPAAVRAYAQPLDAALADIRLCDPAIGSGAFPVGMLHEIVQARLALSTHLGDQRPDRFSKPVRSSVRSAYELKRHAIQQSIYGVDIDAGAVEIAKLRLWLSLVVDESYYDDIQPLPNLDYKIVQGNALLGVEKNLFNLDLFNRLDRLKQQFFDATHRHEKRTLKAQIDQLIELLTGEQKTFDFEVYFHEVFAAKGGFDVVIGNPPYLRIQGIRKSNPKLANQYKALYKSATGSFDLYALFVERGLKILAAQGFLNFIMPDKWTNAGFGKGLRSVIAKGQHGFRLISFGAHQIFHASTYTSLLWLTKQAYKHLQYFQFDRDFLTGQELKNALYNLKPDNFNPIPASRLSADVWVLTNRAVGNVLERMSKQPRRLSQVFEKIFQGIATSKDSVYFLYDCHHDGKFIEGYSKELDKRVHIESGLMKPLLKGDQVHRYVTLRSNSFVLFPYRLYLQDGKEIASVMSPDYIQERFPHGWDYLLMCEEAIKGRERGRLAKDVDWYRYIYPKNSTLFQKEKLVSPDISLGGNFAYDVEGRFYMTTTVYGYIKYPHIIESYNFWLALMNSKLLWFYLQNTGTVLANNYFRYKPAYLESFPVPSRLSTQQAKAFDTLVDYIIYVRDHVNIKKAANARDAVMVNYFEQIIDALIYELYFTDELHQHDRQVTQHLTVEDLPSVKQLRGDKISELRQVFERLFERNHPLRQAIFYLDGIETVRIIEGQQK